MIKIPTNILHLKFAQQMRIQRKWTLYPLSLVFVVFLSTIRGKKTFPSILDKLNVHGPNGTHTCYVTTPASLSLSGAKVGSWISLFQLDVALLLATHLFLLWIMCILKEFFMGIGVTARVASD